MNIFIIIFIAAVSFALGIRLATKEIKPEPITNESCLEFITVRNTPDNILSCIDFVGERYRFSITTDFRLTDLRNEYETLRNRIYELAVYLQTDIGMKDKEHNALRQQLASMYLYLEIIELRCINQKFLIPNDIQEES